MDYNSNQPSQVPHFIDLDFFPLLWFIVLNHLSIFNEIDRKTSLTFT